MSFDHARILTMIMAELCAGLGVVVLINGRGSNNLTVNILAGVAVVLGGVLLWIA